MDFSKSVESTLFEAAAGLTDPEERLDRHPVLARFDRPVLTENALALVTIDADHGPVRLLAGHASRIDSARCVTGDGLEEGFPSGRPGERLHRERTERRRILAAGNPHAEPARLRFR